MLLFFKLIYFFPVPCCNECYLEEASKSPSKDTEPVLFFGHTLLKISTLIGKWFFFSTSFSTRQGHELCIKNAFASFKDIKQNFGFSLNFQGKCQQIVGQHLFVPFRALKGIFCFLPQRYKYTTFYQRLETFPAVLTGPRPPFLFHQL